MKTHHYQQTPSGGSDHRLVRLFPLNSEVSIRAWWWPDARLVKCRVVNHWKTNDEYMTVQPVTGNTHQRDVKLGRDFDLPNASVMARPDGSPNT